MSRPALNGPWTPAGAALAAVLAAVSCQAPPPVPHETAALEGGPSLRGLHAGPDSIVWAGGSAGTVARSLDGGRSWERLLGPPGAEGLDFRDVHAFSAEEAVLLAAGPGEASRLYRTTDGGRSWAETWRNRHPEGFLDGMDFWSDGEGLAVGDPIDGRLMLLRTTDSGRSWRAVPAAACPTASEGEYAFAASGTSLCCADDGSAWIGTGGATARVLRSVDRGASWTPCGAPFAAGEGAGIFSVAFADADRGVAVGGDYLAPTNARMHAAWSDDGGRSWQPVAADAGPGGYRSCVALLADGSWLAVGPTGVDRSTDGGRSWAPCGTEGWHSASGTALSGSAGRLGRLD